MYQNLISCTFSEQPGIWRSLPAKIHPMEEAAGYMVSCPAFNVSSSWVENQSVMTRPANFHSSLRQDCSRPQFFLIGQDLPNNIHNCVRTKDCGGYSMPEQVIKKYRKKWSKRLTNNQLSKTKKLVFYSRRRMLFCLGKVRFLTDRWSKWTWRSG